MKLGLVSIHVVSDAQIIAAADNAIAGPGAFYERLDITQMSQSDKGLDDLPFWVALGSPATKTDADGRFTVRMRGKSWLLAHASRKVGDKDESYTWAVPVESATRSLLLSNDNKMDTPNASRGFLENFTGIRELAHARVAVEAVKAAATQIAAAESEAASAARQTQTQADAAERLAAAPQPASVVMATAKAATAESAVALAKISALLATGAAGETIGPLAERAALEKARLAKLQAAQAAVFLDAIIRSETAAEARAVEEQLVALAAEVLKFSNETDSAAEEAELALKAVAAVPGIAPEKEQAARRLALSAQVAAKEATQAAARSQAAAGKAKEAVAVKVAVETANQAARSAMNARAKSEAAARLANDAARTQNLVEVKAAAEEAQTAAREAARALVVAQNAQSYLEKLGLGVASDQALAATRSAQAAQGALETAQKAQSTATTQSSVVQDQAKATIDKRVASPIREATRSAAERTAAELSQTAPRMAAISAAAANAQADGTRATKAAALTLEPVVALLATSARDNAAAAERAAHAGAQTKILNEAQDYATAAAAPRRRLR